MRAHLLVVSAMRVPTADGDSIISAREIDDSASLVVDNYVGASVLDCHFYG